MRNDDLRSGVLVCVELIPTITAVSYTHLMEKRNAVRPARKRGNNSVPLFYHFVLGKRRPDIIQKVHSDLLLPLLAHQLRICEARELAVPAERDRTRFAVTVLCHDAFAGVHVGVCFVIVRCV